MATLALFFLMVKLGLWQLSRAEEKDSWQAELHARQEQAPLSFSQLLSQTDSIPLTGFGLEVTASPVARPLLLLDNQVYQGRVGYLAYQIMEVAPSQPWLLLELGFVAAGPRRDTLPSVQRLDEAVLLKGRLYQRQTNPLSDRLLPEPGHMIRFQNLNLPALGEYLGHPLVGAVLQPLNLTGLDIGGQALEKPWQPIPLSAQKHRGYALQWFSMATVFAGLMLWLLKGAIVAACKENQSQTKPLP